MSEFFVLEAQITPKTAFETRYLHVEPLNLGDAPRCPSCGGPIGPLRWLSPFRVKLETWGKAFGDIAFGPDLLVSERFASFWKQAGLIGLEGFDPAELVKVVRHGRLKDYPPRYFRVDVVKSKAVVDDSASDLEREGGPLCSDCRIGGIIKRARRIVLEPSPAAPEDLFIARGLPGTILASERFHAFCADYNILNAVLMPASSYSFDFYPGG